MELSKKLVEFAKAHGLRVAEITYKGQFGSKAKGYSLVRQKFMVGGVYAGDEIITFEPCEYTDYKVMMKQAGEPLRHYRNITQALKAVKLGEDGVLDVSKSNYFYSSAIPFKM